MRKTSNCAVSHGLLRTQRCIRAGTVAASLARSSYIRQYHRVFLSPYYRITPHLRSSSRRPKSFRGRGGERRGGSDESGRGGGGGERKREREIEFLGCILKPVELSGNCREAKSAGGTDERGPSSGFIFPFVCPLLYQPISSYTFDLFI